MPTSGSYSLSGSGSIKFGIFITDTFKLRLSRTGLSLEPNSAGNLNFGVLDVPFATFGLGSSGTTSFNGSKSVDSGWLGFIGVWARLKGTVSVSSSANGTITANLGYDFYYWVGFQPGVGEIPATNQHIGGSGDIDSDGKISVNASQGGQNGFNFRLW